MPFQDKIIVSISPLISSSPLISPKNPLMTLAPLNVPSPYLSFLHRRPASADVSGAIGIPKWNPGEEASRNGIDSKALDVQTQPSTGAPTSRDTFEYKFDLTMEPTPFPPGGYSLKASRYTRNSYVLVREPVIFVEPSASSLFDGDGKAIAADHDTRQPLSKRQKLVDAILLSQQKKRTKKTTTPPTRRDPKMIMSKTTQEAKWEEFFLSLLSFKKQNGHCHVPHAYPQDPDLSRWAKRQRRQYNLLLDQKPSYISYERIQKLESIGFVWDPQWCVWDARRQELSQYLLEHGNCNVPYRYAKNPQLGMWVKRQRRQYKLFQSGRLPRLPPERFRILNDMGFEWDRRLPKGTTGNV